jgi:hypothetical protein
MCAIGIMAVMVAAAMPFIIGDIQWAQTVTDYNNYTVFNDALTRCKCEGGGTTGMTQGASVARIWQEMQTPTQWGNITHQFMRTGYTYPARSIGATGNGAQYHFSRVNSYSDGSGQDNTTTGGSWPAFVAVAYGGGTSTAYSTDGITWVAGGNLATTDSCSSLIYGGGKFMALGASGNPSYSTDGVHWTASSALPTGAGAWTSVIYGNGKFVAIDPAPGKTSNNAAYSTDGITWTASPGGLPVSTAWNHVAYGNGKFVAISGNIYAAYSTNGSTWIASSQGLFAYIWTGLAYGNGTFVAVCNGTPAYYSTDGMNWNPCTLTSAASCIAYGSGTFVAIGGGSTSVAYSTDGIHWTTNTTGLPSTAVWSSITYGSGKFVAVSNTSTAAAYSTDGIHWTASPGGLPSSGDWIVSASQ